MQHTLYCTPETFPGFVRHMPKTPPGLIAAKPAVKVGTAGPKNTAVIDEKVDQRDVREPGPQRVMVKGGTRRHLAHTTPHIPQQEQSAQFLASVLLRLTGRNLGVHARNLL
jgi:hypothetical protein